MSDVISAEGVFPVVDCAGHSIALAELPTNSQVALMLRGLRHLLGNEQASKVSALKEKREKAGEPALAPDEEAATKAGFVADAVAALFAGTVGVRTGGGVSVSVSPLDKAMRRIALKEVTVVLAQNKLKVPTGDNKLVMPNGTEWTREELITRRLAAHGDRIRTEAEAELKAEARKAKKLAEAGGDVTEMLGL